MKDLRIGIIGTGYVGLVTGLCLADFGFHVTCADIDVDKVDSLRKGNLPVYEPGLDVIFERVTELERIDFTWDIDSMIKKCNVIFMCVGTPPLPDGSADLKAVWQVATSIGREMETPAIIVDKSTVPVGTSRKVTRIIEEELRKRDLLVPFHVVSNPEFLREGKALYDFTHPDRVVIGTDSHEASEIMKNIYGPLKLNEVPFVLTSPETAELIKYASNAFLATKIAFINEIANLCEEVDADVQKVAHAMGMDGRISDKFLHPGPGYGGSCFPKDTKALVRTARDNGLDLSIVDSVIKANEKQKARMVCKIQETFEGYIDGKVIAILGLSFKAETDDVRESPALHIIPELIDAGAHVRVYDPKGMPETRKALKRYEPYISYASDEYCACEEADALAILTDWNQFRRLDLMKLATIMNGRRFFDFRNMYDPLEVYNAGFCYEGVGKNLRSFPGTPVSVSFDLDMEQLKLDPQVIERN
jgi:UDPglucose 6-dehydrogenase